MRELSRWWKEQVKEKKILQVDKKSRFWKEDWQDWLKIFFTIKGGKKRQNVQILTSTKEARTEEIFFERECNQFLRKNQGILGTSPEENKSTMNSFQNHELQSSSKTRIRVQCWQENRGNKFWDSLEIVKLSNFKSEMKSSNKGNDIKIIVTLETKWGNTLRQQQGDLGQIRQQSFRRFKFSQIFPGTDLHNAWWFLQSNKHHAVFWAGDYIIPF